jgi:hypothetical protein
MRDQQDETYYRQTSRSAAPKRGHDCKEGVLGKSKLAQYDYEDGHRVSWDAACRGDTRNRHI